MSATQEWQVVRGPHGVEVQHRTGSTTATAYTTALGLLRLVREIASVLQADPAPERGPFRWAAQSTTHTRRTRLNDHPRPRWRTPARSVAQRIQCVAFLAMDGGAIGDGTLTHKMAAIAEIVNLADVMATLRAPGQPHHNDTGAPWRLDRDGLLLPVGAAEGVRIEATDWLDGNSAPPLLVLASASESTHF